MKPERIAEMKAWARRRRQMKAMRKEGKTFQQIGDFFGISKQRVAQHLKGA